MKTLMLADLHLVLDGVRDHYRENYQDHVIFPTIKNILKHHPDIGCVLIAGDVFEDVFDLYKVGRINETINPFVKLHDIFKDIPVVFCLGNHEFACSTIGFTHEAYNYSFNISPYKNITCLDNSGHKIIENEGKRYLVVGNVLWYDGNCSDRQDREALYNNISSNWLDHTIAGFNAKEASSACVKQIKENLSEHDDCDVKILLTHCVPHRKLNLHDANSFANVYSGFGDLFNTQDISVDWAICGHTHKRVTAEIETPKGLCKCINVGQDYWDGLKFDLLEI